MIATTVLEFWRFSEFCSGFNLELFPQISFCGCHYCYHSHCCHCCCHCFRFCRCCSFCWGGEFSILQEFQLSRALKSGHSRPSTQSRRVPTQSPFDFDQPALCLSLFSSTTSSSVSSSLLLSSSPPPPSSSPQSTRVSSPSPLDFAQQKGILPLLIKLLSRRDGASKSFICSQSFFILVSIFEKPTLAISE